MKKELDQIPKVKNRVVWSAMRTPDGTIIESRHRHDYVTHIDKNGKEYMLDGGLDYVRCSAWGDEEFLTLTLDDDWDKVRDKLRWGTFGKNGDEPLHYLKLGEMDTAHIEAILEHEPGIYPQYMEAFRRELVYRKYGE